MHAWWVLSTAVPKSSAAGTTCAGWSWSWPSAPPTSPNQPGSPTFPPKTTTKVPVPLWWLADGLGVFGAVGALDTLGDMERAAVGVVDVVGDQD